jgi:hypothetical protein
MDIRSFALLLFPCLPLCATTAEPLFIEGKEINESSGLARSQRIPARLWTINDSGNAPILFGIDTKGKIHRRLRLPVRNQDWESLCSFKYEGKPYVLIADVGDNKRQRDNCRLYLFPEPDDEVPDSIVTLSLTYADGSHNCEAVAVDPYRREILLIEKHNKPKANLFVAPLNFKSGTIVAKPIAEVPVTTATGMDLSPDGRRLIVITYGHAYEFIRPGTDASWAEHVANRRKIQLPPRAQGETVCYSRDGKTLLLTSERLPATIHRVPVD